MSNQMKDYKAPIIAFLTIITLAIGIWEFFVRSKPDLIAEVHCYPFAVPVEPTALDAKADWSKTETYIVIKVSNAGDLICNAVKLRLPSGTYMKVERQGTQPIVSPSRDLLDIGDLQPRESITVTEWTNVDLHASTVLS